MLKLLKHARPFYPIILLILLLLFLQANADLALPDYMSRIVNVGIQQGGVESPVPEAIRQSTMEHLVLFLSSEEKTGIMALYARFDRDSPEYEILLRKYPALAREPVYVLKSADPEAIERVKPVIARAILAVFSIEQLQANPEQAWRILGFSPKGADLFTLVSQLPADQRMRIRELVERRFNAMGGEKAIFQAAARAVRAEYESLGMDVAKIQNSYILKVGSQMLIIALVAAAITIIVGFLAAKVAAGFARDLRRLFFEKVLSFSSAELDRFSTASLITRATNDITQIQTVMVFLLRMVFYAPIIGIGAVIRALGKSPSMWWILGLGIGILIGLVTIGFRLAVPRFKIIQTLMDQLNRIARENLTGAMVVRAFNRQRYEEERFDRANKEYIRTILFVNKVFVMMMPLTMFLMNGIMILILWVGAHQVAQATIRLGDMMAFLQYAMQVFFSFMMLSMLSIMIPRADVAAGRIAEVLETDTSIKDPEKPCSFPQPFVPKIEFRHVSFRYPGAEEYVLRDINFTIQPGETVGIIGTTGSGKSTLISLLLRFYDVTEGEILISGVDIRRVCLKDLRDCIGYVPQHSNLFSGTVESNLLFANENASREFLYQALEIAQTRDFVLSNPHGLSMSVAQGGMNLSGGQRQRLTIARALVKRAPIYVFDDCFSSLDYQTDLRVRRALREHLKGSTIIIISQRVATIKDADKILVLDEGKLIAQGTHEELLEKCEVYREIALSQLKLQEVVI